MVARLEILVKLYVFSVSGTMKPSAQVRVFRSGRAPSVRAFPCSRASVFCLSSCRRFKMRSRRPKYTSSGATLPRASWYRSAGVPAGFPSPADDYIDCHLDLHEHLIEHPAATFYVRVSGASMVGAGIHDGDLLIVDRAAGHREGSGGGPEGGGAAEEQSAATDGRGAAVGVAGIAENDRAEDAENGADWGKAEPRREAASQWDAARQDSSLSIPSPPAGEGQGEGA